MRVQILSKVILFLAVFILLCLSEDFSYVFLARRYFVIVKRGRVVTCLCLVTSSLGREK